MEINISVSKKVAFAERGTIVVCGNGDYVAKFTFDEEWAKYETKTARFKWGGKYTDVVFSGDECAMPIINNTCIAEVGVYAGDLHTTTPALIRCKRSILCGNEPESPASQEVRNEFLRVLDKRTGDLADLQTDAKDNLVAAINEAAASGGADWAQNDPTAKDYVKNRTHWVEMSYEEKYTNDNAPFVDNGFGVINFTPDSVTWDLVDRDNYSVLFDGNEYRCVCHSASRYGRTWLWVGNAALGAPYNEFEPNSGEPFLITDSGIIAKSAGNHAIRISRVGVNIHRLPEAFMDLDGVWDSIDIATEKANTAIAGTQLVVTQLKVGDINVGETYSSAVKVANGVSTLVAVSGPAYIIAAGNQSTVKQFIYLNKMLSGDAYTGMFAELNASEDGVGRVYGVYVNVKDAIAKFTRIA